VSIKKEVITLIRKMREDVTEEEIIDSLLVRQQIKRGLEDVAAGRVGSHAAFGKRIRKWRKSVGR
jgi:predicted transcriptional regulator